MPRGAENREAGESPARSRHCKQGAKSECHWETGKAAAARICEPGNLPDVGTGIVIPDHE